MMKRSIALLLCLCLLLSAASALAAEKVNVNFYTRDDNVSSGNDKYIRSTVAIGDVLYLLTNNTFEQWTPGDELPTVLFTLQLDLRDAEAETDKEAAEPAADAEPASDEAAPTEAAAEQTEVKAEEPASDEAAAEPSDDAQTESGNNVETEEETFRPEKLFVDGGNVYGLSLVSGQVWLIVENSVVLPEPAKKVMLDWKAMERTTEGEEYTHSPQMYDTIVMDGNVYMVTTDWDRNGNSTYEMIVWNFETGAAVAAVKDYPIRSITPYKDGLLLCKLHDDMKSWDEATQTQIMPKLGTYNTKTGEVTELLSFEQYNVYGLRYNAANDTLYYVQRASVYSMPGVALPAKISAYLPVDAWDDTSISLLESGMVTVGDYNGVVVRELDMPGIENGALTIYGEYGSTGHRAYMNKYPQMMVTTSDAYYSNLEAFTSAMVSGENAVDVLRLESDYTPIGRLIDKGYALDLSGYADLTGIAGQMDENLISPVMRDGKLYGLPVNMYANGLGYNTKVWKEMGLTEDDLPQTTMELMDFIANWEADYADDYPNYRLLEGSPVKDTLFNWITNNYIAYQKKQGETLSFDTELFRKLIAKLEEIDIKEEIDPDSEEYWSKEAVFTTYSMATNPDQYKYGQTVLVLPLDEGLEPAITVSVEYMIINPRSTRIDQAVQYITTFAQNLDRYSGMVTLYPGNNEPIPNLNYESDMEDLQKEAESQRKAIEKAKPEEKANLQANLDSLLEWITEYETRRYDLTAEDIAFYREKVAPYLVVVGQNPFTTWDEKGENEFYNLQSQYLSGAMKADQYVKEIDKRIRMMQLEDQ